MAVRTHCRRRSPPPSAIAEGRGAAHLISGGAQVRETRAERVEERHHRPVRSRRSDARIAVVNGAAFSRACASVMDSRGSLRRLCSHVRHSNTVTRTTINPAANKATATIGHMLPYLSRDPGFRLGHSRPVAAPARSASAVAPECLAMYGLEADIDVRLDPPARRTSRRRGACGCGRWRWGGVAGIPGAHRLADPFALHSRSLAPG
jgi:hypothetical protein